MNPIVKAIDDLKYTIPIQILQLAFQRDLYNQYNPNISLDEHIRLKVINPRVLVDCNLAGGPQVMIPLDGVQPMYADQFTTVFQIPPHKLANRTIMSVLSVSYLPYQANFNTQGGSIGYLNPTSMNSVTQAAQRVADSVSTIPIVSNALVDLIGHNVVSIAEPYRISSIYYLRCILENEENLNNIRPRSIMNFSRLVELAVKSYIYNKLIVRIDRAFLEGGQELGRVKEIIDGYAEAEEMYRTYLKEVWSKVAIMNDVPSYDRLIKLSVCPAI